MKEIQFKLDIEALLAESRERLGDEQTTLLRKALSEKETAPEEGVKIRLNGERKIWAEKDFLHLVEGEFKDCLPLLWKHTALAHRMYNTPKEDFTFYLQRSPEGEPDCLERLLNHQSGEAQEKQQPNPASKKRPAKDRKLSFDCGITIYDREKQTTKSGRVLACACFEGEYWSLTFRKKGESDYQFGAPPDASCHANYSSAEKPAGEEAPGAGNATAVDDSQQPAEKKTKPPNFLNTIPDIGDTLYKQVFANNEREYEGLVVVTGRTASAKSKIIRRMIYDYLHGRQNYFQTTVKRRPHLLTFEDPIEEYYYERNKQRLDDPQKYQDYGIDYTPRQLHKDADDLESVLKDALRQTPAVVYVGETRSDKEWELLVRFAGTGHLVFTTAHAGSLTEAMGKIIAGMGKETPALRSALADRLLAVIHIKNTEVGGEGTAEEKASGEGIEVEKKLALVPNLWRRTPSGVKAFMSEGRASLLPHNPHHENGAMDDTDASIGRVWFASRFLRKAAASKSQEEPLAFYEKYKSLLDKAVEWDLEGM